jgi:hypothetical protein
MSKISKKNNKKTTRRAMAKERERERNKSKKGDLDT